MTRDEMVGYLRMAYEQAQFSPDLSTHNGAVLVDASGKCIGAGCNRVIPMECKTPDRLQRPAKYEWTTHAEVDAILDAVRRGHSPVGGTLVAAWAACAHCGQVIVGSGVKRVVRHRHEHMEKRADWMKSIEVADEMFRVAGVEVFEVFDTLGTRVLFNGEYVEV